MIKRKVLIAVVPVVAAIAVGAGVLVSGGASAGQGGALDDGKELLPKARISLAEAISAARGAASGEVDEVDLEYWQGRLVFNVDVGDLDVKVDAETGAVLGMGED
jgi:uncharacterized membrane protein YkoI